jgi:hydrogenase maturation protease
MDHVAGSGGQMTRVLVAGVGNVFFGDDGFGPAVIERLRTEVVPAEVEVLDFGVRTLHLAFELLIERDLLVVVDAVSRRSAPGTLYVLEPDRGDDVSPSGVSHGMDLEAAIAMARAMGARCPWVVVGCEPEDVSEGLGLSEVVQNAIAPASQLVRKVLAGEIREHRDLVYE